jgi:uncharacterized membrane protein YoaK (UPF0700 family)
MFKKMIAQAKKPKKPISIRDLLRMLVLQMVILFFCLVGITFFPDRVPAFVTFIFLGFAIAVGLWVDIREAGITPAVDEQQKSPS